jgi:predicted protein tyrosine phosphatase
MIHVCPLRHVGDVVARTGARRLVTIINEGTPVVRPRSVADADYLALFMNDVNEAADGVTLPAVEHVERLIAFGRAWDRAAPLVIHCFAGVSRSTAAAYIVAAALKPERDETELAKALRQASPSATPNKLLIALADAQLGRNGRMSEAITSIGRGAECFEGRPFGLAVG